MYVHYTSKNKKVIKNIMSFESAPTYASVPAAEKDRFDFRDDVYQMQKQEADRAERDAVENATYAAQAERAGKAGGRFDFSQEHTAAVAALSAEAYKHAI